MAHEKWSKTLHFAWNEGFYQFQGGINRVPLARVEQLQKLYGDAVEAIRHRSHYAFVRILERAERAERRLLRDEDLRFWVSDREERLSLGEFLAHVTRRRELHQVALRVRRDRRDRRDQILGSQDLT